MEGCASFRGPQERQEARRWVAEALASRTKTVEEQECFLRARGADPSYDVSSCERGLFLERSGDLTAAAQSYRACFESDPEQAYAFLRYGETLLRSRGFKATTEVGVSFRRFLELTAHTPGADEDRRRIAGLLVDLERYREREGRPAFPERYSAAEIVAILRREERGQSRYDGPRVPLRLGFRPGDAILRTTAREQLREVVHALRDGSLAKDVVLIEGHTDDVEGDTHAARLALARRRAEAVKGFLVRGGIPPDRLTLAAYADDYPLDLNRTEAGRAANRRVELVNLRTGAQLQRDAREPGPDGVLME